MKPENTFVRIQRVNNGWVISAQTYAMYREGGYVPDESLVAETPEKLASIIQAWAAATQHSAS